MSVGGLVWAGGAGVEEDEEGMGTCEGFGGRELLADSRAAVAVAVAEAPGVQAVVYTSWDMLVVMLLFAEGVGREYVKGGAD